MGTGTDVAIESVGVTLLRGDLMGIVRARQLSKATMRNIRQNLVLAFVYNVVGERRRQRTSPQPRDPVRRVRRGAVGGRGHTPSFRRRGRIRGRASGRA